MIKNEFSIATWNINSVRLRIELLTLFLERYKPDILCLQETKCIDTCFPFDAFIALGYKHIHLHGQKGYHGVATISRHPLKTIMKKMFTDKEEARHLSIETTIGKNTFLLHNFYVPAGGDIPDPLLNKKFAQKLKFITEMEEFKAYYDNKTFSILAGDLNIAPLEHDVWSHKQLLNVVSHTPIETEKLEHMRKKGSWVDLMRSHVPYEEKLYTWWSYRAKNWKISNKGRRLDHIWSSPNLEEHLIKIAIIKEARDWSRPSDHVPVIAYFKN